MHMVRSNANGRGGWRGQRPTSLCESSHIPRVLAIVLQIHRHRGRGASAFWGSDFSVQLRNGSLVMAMVAAISLTQEIARNGHMQRRPLVQKFIRRQAYGGQRVR
jgi:hypothetical protein